MKNKLINANIEINVIPDNKYPIICSLFFNILSSITVLIPSYEVYNIGNILLIFLLLDLIQDTTLSPLYAIKSTIPSTEREMPVPKIL